MNQPIAHIDYVELAKESLSTIFIEPVYKSAIFGKSLKKNCLPAHLAILNKVKERHPQATVVIGKLKNSEELTKDTLLQRKAFQQDPLYRYHAWIVLNKFAIGDSDILDITTPVTDGLSVSLLDQNTAKKYGYSHTPLLTDFKDVLDYFSKLVFDKKTYSEFYSLDALETLSGIASKYDWIKKEAFGEFGNNEVRHRLANKSKYEDRFKALAKGL